MSGESGRPDIAVWRAVGRWLWRPRSSRIGLLLCGAAMLLMNILAVYHTVWPTETPANVSVREVWEMLPVWERRLVAGNGVCFAVGLVLVGIGAWRHRQMLESAGLPGA